VSCSKAQVLLGFAARAGKVLSGSFACEKALRKGQAALLVLEDTVSENTKKLFTTLAERENVCVWLCSEESDTMHLAGQAGCKVLVVTDREFARKIAAELNISAECQ